MEPLEGAGLLRILGKQLNAEMLESGKTVAVDGLLLGADLQLSKGFIEALHCYRFWVREQKPQPPV